MANYTVKHITKYTYGSTVIDCANHIMLYPVKSEVQLVKNHTISISSHPKVEQFTDFFGNTIGIFSILQPMQELTILSNIEIEVVPKAIADSQTPVAEQWMLLSQMKEVFPYLDFMKVENCTSLQEINLLANQLLDKEQTPFVNAQVFSKYVYDHFEYDKSVTNVETEIDEIWNLKAGVCQDFAHILLVLLRIIGIPSRYVSGYICPQNNEWRGEGATHAWVEICIPTVGWVGIDPTNNCIVSDKHIKLAIGRNFNDCTPVKGTYKGSAEHTLSVSVVIENEAHTTNKNTTTPLIFSYQSKKQAPDNNSYRKYMEIQQQQ
jgi:transglutaminase-like putative cysteine protease